MRVTGGLLAWAALMWLLGLAIWLAWVAAGGTRRSVTGAVFWLLLAIGAVGSLFEDKPMREAVVLAGTVVLVWLAYRLGEMKGFQLITTWAAFFALILPLATALGTWLSYGESHVQDQQAVSVGSFKTHPDVVILVADAHGAFSVLSDLYDFDAAPALKSLEESGMTVNPGMRANYPLTFLSIPSFFRMAYPIQNDATFGHRDLIELQESLGGDNQLVDLFKSEGYEFVMVEAGWSGSRCKVEVDVCVNSPWPDEATAFAIDRSVFNLWNGFFKGSLTSGTLSTLGWLEDDLPSYQSNGRPDLIFAHLLIPHPPLRLGSDCAFQWRPDMGGRSVGLPAIDDEILVKRKAAYIEQVQCAESVISRVASKMGDDVVFITFGDHGPDSGAQLFKAPPDWSASDVNERMRIFFAAKAGPCNFENVRSLVNVGRHLLSCLSGNDVPVLKDRYFLATGVEGPVGESLPVREIQMAGD